MSEAAQSRRDRWEDRLQFRDQMDLTNRATNAAVMSADATTRQAMAAEAALVQLERPYVFIFGVRGIKQDQQTHDFFVEYTVANYGKMPAIIEGPHIGFEISERAEPPTILQAGEQRKKTRAYFSAGMVGDDINVVIETVRAADVDPNAILAGKEEPPETVVPIFTIPDGFDIFFRAAIRYRGPFTADHETGAVWIQPRHFRIRRARGRATQLHKITQAHRS